MKVTRMVGRFSCLAVILMASGLHAATSDAINTLGFEDVSTWTSTNASLALSATSTQGKTSLSVTTSGYSTVVSRLLGPLGTVSPTTTMDVLIPTELKASAWMGALQLFLSIPSLNIYNRYLGDKALSAYPVGAFTTMGFPIPEDIRSLLASGAYRDLSFSIAFNLPTDRAHTVLVDNLRFSATVPGDTTVGRTDISRILDFEDASLWTITPGTKKGLSATYRTSRNFSLDAIPVNYTTITSVPLSSWGVVDSSLKFKLRLPQGNEALAWAGALQAIISSPSRGVQNQNLGQIDLTKVVGGEFKPYAFTIPPTVVAALNAGYFSDLTITLVLNVPYNNSNDYYVDELRLGKLPDDSSGTVLVAQRKDLVGVSNTGTVAFTTDSDGTQNPTLTLAEMDATALDGTCAPSATDACSFQVNSLQVFTSGFTAFTNGFSNGTLRNNAPFRITIGGSYGMTAPIPADTPFTFAAKGSPTYVAIVYPSGTNSSMYISPAGNGMMSIAANFSARIGDHTISIGVTTSANTPLANRPPVAVMKTPNVLTGPGTRCLANILLDATGTTDPDGNLDRTVWRRGNGSIFATGAKATLLASKSGSYPITLEAIDVYGSHSTQTTTVAVVIPAGCH